MTTADDRKCDSCGKPAYPRYQVCGTCIGALRNQDQTTLEKELQVDPDYRHPDTGEVKWVGNSLPCPICGDVMWHRQVGNTHTWDCEECPAKLLEYHTRENLWDLLDRIEEYYLGAQHTRGAFVAALANPSCLTCKHGKCQVHRDANELINLMVDDEIYYAETAKLCGHWEIDPKKVGPQW